VNPSIEEGPERVPREVVLVPEPPPDATFRRHLDLLVELLADDSPVVLAGVEAELKRLGRRALPALRRAHGHEVPEVRARSRRLLLEHDRAHALRRLIGYAARPEHDLEQALFLLAAHQTPGADLRPYRRALDAMGDAVRNRRDGHAPGSRRAMELIHYLNGDLGFDGAAEDYHHPDNIHLQRTIERRVGMPLTLCALYSAVAKRAGMRAGLLPLPGHVVLQMTDGGDRVIVDVFGGGKVLSERDCLAYLAKHGFPYHAEWFREASGTAMFLRQVKNLVHSYRARSRRAEARSLLVVHDLLAEESALPVR